MIAAHPDLAAELAEFFINQDRIARLAIEFPPTSDARPRVPRRIRHFGDYESLEEIAHGGMGVIYKAWQRSLNRTVAVKMVLGDEQASDSALRRFRTEANLIDRNDSRMRKSRDGLFRWPVETESERETVTRVRIGPPRQGRSL